MLLPSITFQRIPSSETNLEFCFIIHHSYTYFRIPDTEVKQRGSSPHLAQLWVPASPLNIVEQLLVSMTELLDPWRYKYFLEASCGVDDTEPRWPACPLLYVHCTGEPVPDYKHRGAELRSCGTFRNQMFHSTGTHPFQR